MNPSTNIEQRITELEIKASFAEDQLDQLDKVIVRQQQQIDALIREITSLRQQAPESGAGISRNLREDLPPHF
ncbi:MAG: SlyX family protein [Rhodoferax sp.]|nr:SlyX family protein [Rhodoferax sp.]MBP7573322.1 SlyX family protein [Rhodoferax sp.]